MMCPVNYDYSKCNKKGYNKGISNCIQCKHLVKTDKKNGSMNIIVKELLTCFMNIPKNDITNTICKLRDKYNQYPITKVPGL